MILSHIVAAAENNVIGTDNKLPWNIPEDMKFFKDTTRGHIVIMGRKTYASMGRPLTGRLNIVITRQSELKIDGCLIAPSLTAAIEMARAELPKWPEEVFIIGGGEIYQASLDLVDRVYLTRVHMRVAGDTKYPTIDPKAFKEIARRECPGDPAYTFLTYERR